MLIENVEEKLLPNPAILFLTDYFGYRSGERDAFQKLLFKDLMASMDVGRRELPPGFADHYISMGNLGKSEHGRGVYRGQQVVDFQAKTLGQLRQVLPAATIVDNFEETAYPPDASVRKHWEP